MKQDPVSEETANNAERGLQVFFLCIAANFFLFAFILVVWNFYELLTFDKTEGEVASIGVRETGGKTPSTSYELWVGFRVSKYHIYTRAGTSAFYKPYEKGDKLIVYYDPQNPNVAFINFFGTIWFSPTALFLIGLILLIMSRPSKDDLKIIYKKLFG